jgi:hypothetical protein
MSKCKHNVPCGCGDQPFTTQPSCENGTPECPSPDLCPETFCAGCVVYCGDSIADLGIMQGDRMDKVIQMLTLAITNPGCLIPSLTGAITGIDITVSGNGYTPVFVGANTPLLGGSGSGALGTVTTGAGGEVLSVTITNPGIGYVSGDILYPDPSVVGVPATAAAFTISTVECKAVVGLHSTMIGSTSVALAWFMDPSSTSYQVEYKEAAATSWILNTAVTPTANPVDTIGGLTPDTEYHIRVNNFCVNGSCHSVTIIVKTKP